MFLMDSILNELFICIIYLDGETGLSFSLPKGSSLTSKNNHLVLDRVLKI